MFVDEKAKGEVPDFKLGTISLSTAIRLGCQMAPQSHIGLFHGGATCAQGAALMGLGRSYGDSEGWKEAIQTLVGGDPIVTIPAGRREGSQMRLVGSVGAIAYLNDEVGSVKWSREQIADWLEAQGY